MRRGWSQVLFSGSLWQEQRQAVQTETQEFPSEHQDYFFSTSITEPWHRLPESLWSLFHFRYSKSIWTSSWAGCFRYPYLSRLVGANGRGHFQPQPLCDSLKILETRHIICDIVINGNCGGINLWNRGRTGAFLATTRASCRGTEEQPPEPMGTSLMGQS